MKIYKNFKDNGISATILLAFILYTSCTTPTDYTPEDVSSNNPPEVQDQKFKKTSERDSLKKFITEASSLVNMQVRMADIAYSKAKDTLVVLFISSVKDDYQNIQKEMVVLTKKFNQDISENILQRHLDIYNDVIYTERYFDNKYLETLIKINEKTVKQWNKMLLMLTDSIPYNQKGIDGKDQNTGSNAGQTNSDLYNQSTEHQDENRNTDHKATLAKWIRATLPIMEKHIVQSKNLLKRNKNNDQ